MGMREFDQAVQILHDNPDLIRFTEPEDRYDVGAAEGRLGVRFSPTYRRFLQDFGAAQIGETIIFGVVGHEPGDDPELDVVTQTLQRRTQTDLPDRWIVVASRQGTSFHALDGDDRDDDELPVAELPERFDRIHEPNFVADDFGDFLLGEVERHLPRDR